MSAILPDSFSAASPAPLPEGLSEDILLRMYTAMVTVRAYDERALKLQRSGRIGFCVTSTGEEATQIGTVAALRDADWIFPSYRQYGVLMYRGEPLENLAANLFGTVADRVQGRQMPVHYTSRAVRFVSISSVIGTQISQAVGCAMAAQLRKDAVISATYFGDGATSANDFHAGLNFAGVYRAPVLFFCVNNQYAISLPVSRQTAQPELWRKAEAYGIPGVRVDGNDVLAVYSATRAAAERARQGQGPTLLELLTYRAGAHSSSDDPSRYRSVEECELWQTQDPIARLKARLISEWGLWDEDRDTALWTSLRHAIQEATTQAEQQAAPAWTTLFEDVWAEVPPALAAQRDALLKNEQGLTLANEGEFPL
jgi:TPP-dependent pyruvate/acetoin dehydrogenase alpha subunit